MDELKLFLWFPTASDLAPTPITVEFGKQLFRAPVVRTFSSTATFSPAYACHNELAEEIKNVLRKKGSFSFSFV